MAGKTFHGIGNIEDETPPLGPDGAAPEGDDVRGVYSGPTVVDDDKVAAGLERLRALEMPTDPLDGTTESVTDSSSSEPTRIGPPINSNAQRPTAMGRSMSSDLPRPEAMLPPLDPMRGTMFGHTVHLPDLHAPVEAEDTSSPSAPIYTPPAPAPAPPTTQMVRYDPRATLYEGGKTPYPGNASGNTPYPRSAHPFPLAEVFPSHERDLRTETIPPLERRPLARFVIGAVVLAGLGVGTYVFMRQRAADDEIVPAIPVAPPTIGIEQQAPPAPPPPPAGEARAAGETGAPGAAAAAPPPPSAVATPPEPAASPAPSRPPVERAEAAPRPSPSERPRSSRSERRRISAGTAAPAPADTQATDSAPRPAPSKPSSSRRRGVVEEDPDATLPPSSIE